MEMRSGVVEDRGMGAVQIVGFWQTSELRKNLNDRGREDGKGLGGLWSFAQLPHELIGRTVTLIGCAGAPVPSSIRP